MKSVSVVGSTGSVGTQALDVIRANPQRFALRAIGAQASASELVAQAQEFRPQVVAIGDESRRAEVRAGVPPETEVRTGVSGITSLAVEADVIVNAVVGFAGLSVTLEALGAGRLLALANKESLIAAGPLVQRLRTVPGAQLVPVDSEHSALHQCLRSEMAHHCVADAAGVTAGGRHVSRLVLTASGGPFRGKKIGELGRVTVEQALAHPTWKMGPKITVDSSTLLNKGLEVIEAHELFAIGYDRIDVIVHPQSIVHSAVEFTDGSTIAQMSQPDMRLPIGYAMGYPERLDSAFGSVDWSALSSLSFEPPDRKTFRCLDLAYQAGSAGGTAPAWLNAANEVAVSAFLNEQVTWAHISSIIEETLEAHDGTALDSLDVLMEADAEARRHAHKAVEQIVGQAFGKRAAQ